MKPNTSRFANSEKYLICKNFLLEDSYEIVEKFSKYFIYLNSDQSIKRFINIKTPYYFYNKIEDLNAIIGQQQIENIIMTFNLIDCSFDEKNESKLESLKKIHIQKCIQWCIKTKIPFNKFDLSLSEDKNNN